MPIWHVAREGDLVPLLLTKANGPVSSDKNVFSAQTAREVRAMLELAVVQPGGTAPQVRRSPAIASAARPAPRTRSRRVRIRQYKYIASFVGLAPASDPRLIVAVMVDEPSAGKYYGGDVAGPRVFAQLMAGALRTLGVPQDAPIKPVELGNEEQSSQGEHVMHMSVPDILGCAAYCRGFHAPADCRLASGVEPGDVFLAYPGELSDGRKYVAAALERGAAAVVYEANGAEVGELDVPAARCR